MPWSNATSFEAISPEQFDSVHPEGNQIVCTLPTDNGPNLSVQEFEISDIKQTKVRLDRSLEKSGQFKLDSFVRRQLNIANEEEKAFEERVNNAVQIRLAKALKETRQKAYDDGFQRGLTDGTQKALEDEKPHRDNFLSMIQAFSAIRSEVVESNKQFVLEVAYRTARYLLLRELSNDRDYVLRLVTSLMERLQTQKDIRVFLSKEDYKRAIEVDHAIREEIGRLPNLVIDIDENIKLGGCRIETPYGIVDANVHKQLESIAKAMGVNTSVVDLAEAEEMEKKEGPDDVQK